MVLISLNFFFSFFFSLSFLFIHWIWIRALLCRVFLVVDSSLSSLQMFYVTSFWHLDFLLKNQHKAYRDSFVCYLFPLYVISFYVCFFFLVVFIIFSLSLIFVNLLAVCLSKLLFGFILPETLCMSWTCFLFPMFRKFSAIISLNSLFKVLFFVFSL